MCCLRQQGTKSHYYLKRIEFFLQMPTSASLVSTPAIKMPFVPIVLAHSSVPAMMDIREMALNVFFKVC